MLTFHPYQGKGWLMEYDAVPADMPGDRAGAPPRPGRGGMPVLRVLPGVPASARAGRLLARDVLGADHPLADTVMLLVSELVTNAVMHSRSGAPGGTVAVALCPAASGVLIHVRDDGALAGAPRPAGAGILAEHGYGLILVDALADCWGTGTSRHGRVTWCRVSGPSGTA